MSDTQAASEGMAPAAEFEPAGILNEILSATQQANTEKNRATELVRILVDQAMSKGVQVDRNRPLTLEKAIAEIDRRISAQLGAVMQHPQFLALEGSWRGLHHLISHSRTGANLRIRMLPVAKEELVADLARASEFDQSHLWKLVYDGGFGQAGGEPFAALIGDYTWTASEDDVNALQSIAGVAGAAFAPFITSPDPRMFNLTSWTGLDKYRDMSKAFDSVESVNWHAFRETSDARYVVMTMPRVLARRPYGRDGIKISQFAYEEAEIGADNLAAEIDHDKLCWMNAAYALGTCLTAAFHDHGFCTAIRGVESGGKVANLPQYHFQTANGDRDQKCPTEVNIPDRMEAEISALGFMPLIHHKNTNFAAFMGAQTTQKPKVYDDDQETANAAISARLPYIMATGRFAHYLKVMARGKIGSFMEASNCEVWLKRWIAQYVNSNIDAGEELKAKYPLLDARVEVREVPGQPGAYNAVAFLRPRLQMEELTASLRMVARIPPKTS